jgi:fatty acid desaturase
VAIPRPDYDALIERCEAEHKRAAGDTFRDLAKTCVQMVCWVLAGWTFIGFSVHTTNEIVGRILWWTGLGVWISGVLYSLLAAYRRGEQRGDW